MRCCWSTSFFYGSLLVGGGSFSVNAFSQCLGLVKGPVIFDVSACKSVVPKEDFNRSTDLGFLTGLSTADKEKFFAQYRGLSLSGKIIKSEAVSKGIDERKGALAGKDVKLFWGDLSQQCLALQSRRLSVELEQICCNGGVDAPCLIETDLVAKKITVLGNAKSSAGDKERKTALETDEFKKGVKAFLDKDYKTAVAQFEIVKREDKLDVRGHYLLGLSFRNLENCKKAIPVLSVVFDRANKKDVWADQAEIVRKSNFLLARCYARMNQAGRATIILSSYLIEPEKHKEEIQQSLKHPDFGFINASKEYRDYVALARKAMPN